MAGKRQHFSATTIQSSATMTKLKGRRNYTTELKNEVVARVQGGETVAEVSASSGVPERRIREWSIKVKQGKSLEPARPGKKPLLPAEAEQHIYDWVVGRQLVGYPVDRAGILRKANEISLLVCGKSVSDGWYRRFLERNPSLTPRIAQALSLKRNCVVKEDLTTLFNTLAKLVIEHRLDSSRVFNMDETAFQTRKKSKKVVAVRGSSNVWCTDPSVNFHLSIVACGSAAGFVVPPAFILPGKTVQWDILEACEVAGASITTSPSGFINAYLFQKWLQFFANSVPSSVQRPILLVLDGCASHYSADVIDVATSLGILLVLLPPNATHLLQPLDVAVFATLKDKLCNLINEVVEEDDEGCYSIDKVTAIRLAGMAWKSAKIGRNIRVGCKTCGIFPVSLVSMTERLQIYNKNGAPRHVHLASWLHAKPVVEAEVLMLPSPPKKTSKRKRVSVGGRWLTHEVLQELTVSQSNAKAKRQRKRTATETVNAQAHEAVLSVVV